MSPNTIRFAIGDLLNPSLVTDEPLKCPVGTRFCLTQVNVKNETERVVSVIPLAQTARLEPNTTFVAKCACFTLAPPFFIEQHIAPQHITLVFHGAEYPSIDSSTPVAQSVQLTLWCDPQLEKPNITIEAYSGSRLDLTYFGAAGCPLKKDTSGGGSDKPSDGDKDTTPSGSGLGWFFFL